MGNEISAVRDYSLIGEEAEIAIKKGLADAQWYQSPVPRDQMRELLVRKNGPAVRDTLIWISLIIGSGYLVFLFWGTWFVIFPYLVYSALYASTSDSRWHESSHGTAFKTDWMNNVLYEIASFMVFRQSTVWRWSHTRHHSDTIIRGRDPEIAVPRPPDIRGIILTFFGISAAIPESKRLFKHAFGKIDQQVATYLPRSEYGKVFLKARIYLLIFLTVIFLSVFFKTFLPIMFIGLPTLVGSWLMPIYGFTQHAGLQENVLDHRLNCRTVYMNRINRFLYWNMNYHVEHHMFPLVPYHALPALHQAMKDDCPPHYKGIIAAFKELIPAVLRQVKDPTYFVERILPEKHKLAAERDPKIFKGDPSAMKQDRIEVCRIGDLQIGEVVRFDFQQKTYAVYRTAENQFHATAGICTHGNAHLADGVVIGETIECAKHNGRFNLKDGSPARIPVCIGIKTFKVDTDGERIYLNLQEEDRLISETDTEKTFTVLSNRNVATFIKELVLEPAANTAFNFSPGQYIQMVIPPFEAKFTQFAVDNRFEPTWKEIGFRDCYAENKIYTKRNFSLATNPGTDALLKFNVRIELPPDNDRLISAGVGSSYVFSLKPGDKVKMTGPYGNFLIKQGDREMVYLGGGAGMAPLRSHLSYLLETDKTDRKVSFWYGARSLDDLFYSDYFEDLEKVHANFSFKVSLSEPKPQDEWMGYVGFIHEQLWKNYLETHPNPGEIDYYLCGPPSMIQAGLKMLKSIGIEDKMIAFDEF
jgi:Na(+)-translocating NADH:ubiquinone oxidoreductase F subunit